MVRNQGALGAIWADQLAPPPCLTVACNNVRPPSRLARSYSYLCGQYAEAWLARLISDCHRHVRSGLRSALGGSAWAVGTWRNPDHGLQVPCGPCLTLNTLLHRTQLSTLGPRRVVRGGPRSRPLLVTYFLCLLHFQDRDDLSKLYRTQLSPIVSASRCGFFSWSYKICSGPVLGLFCSNFFATT